ncbi:MAG: hypothetical protein KAH17_10270 [Bacteroidales bacterium]|nr:hypothetical protein [Bacteroidales bacterium]
MKKFASLLTFSVLTVFALVVLFPSCEGPEGPTGPSGQDGINGTDGTDGVDANSFCIECHTLDNKNAIKTQFTTFSKHGNPGFELAYAGGRNDCAMCHSHQGFMETTMTGRDTIGTAIPIPVGLQCETCHDFHMTLEEDGFPDYALRNNKPVSLLVDGHATSIDVKGSGNVCSYCHQPRMQAGFPLVPNGTDSIAIHSSHWGTHYGTQSVILMATGGFEIPGSLPYESTAHKTSTDCATCHMNKDGGEGVGGHTYRMKTIDGVENIAACTTCHSSATSFDINGVQTEIGELIHHLEELLMEHKLIDETGHAIPHSADNGLGRKFTSNEAGAVFNLLLIHYEGSHGIHNYKYTKALLTNTIEMAEAW